MRHIISVLVENKFGVLAKIAGLFSARGYNIDSLAVGETSDPRFSRMTVVVKGDDRIIDQVKKQLGKVIEVIEVRDLQKDRCVERDLVLAKVRYDKENKEKVDEVIDKFHLEIADIDDGYVILQLVGEEVFVESAIEELRKVGLHSLVRTGTVAMEKGEGQRCLKRSD